jgi:hypothetical protein
LNSGAERPKPLPYGCNLGHRWHSVPTLHAHYGQWNLVDGDDLTQRCPRVLDGQWPCEGRGAPMGGRDAVEAYVEKMNEVRLESIREHYRQRAAARQ